MAIAPLFSGITASILIAGMPCHEYPDPDEPNIDHFDRSVSDYQTKRLTSNYVEAVTDNEFTIKLTLGPPDSRSMDSKIRFHITLDGIPVWIATAARPVVQKNGGEWEDEVEGVKEGKGHGCKLRKFRFAAIQITTDSPEPARVRRLAQRLLTVGMIEIKVYREDYGKQGGPTPGTTQGFQRPGEVVPEKALKGDAKSHGTTLGAAKKVARGDVWRTNKKDGEDYPMAIFRFMYRSKEALKQLHIIPRTPSPSPSLSPEDEEDDAEGDAGGDEGGDEGGDAVNLTPEQQEKIEARLRAMRAQFAKQNKARRGGSGVAPAAGGKRKITRIKKEHAESRGLGGRSSKRARKEAPVEIDLTGEDDEAEDGNPLFVGRRIDEWEL